jgi:DNA end-binding protein Ku
VARFVLRTNQYLCAVRPRGKALALSTMLFSEEVISESELGDLPEVKPERELKMAEQLLDSLAADFQPHKYKDDYREQVMAPLERKAESEEIAAPEEKPRAKAVDLMDALKKSLAAA